MSPVKILDIHGAIRKMALISILKSFNTIAALSFLIICSTQVQAFEAKVIRILDGDTIEVLKDGSPLRVRLHGIDCPERNQDFGSVARQFTGDKTFGRVVEIVPMDTDKYGRSVAKVYVEGQYLNLMLVAEGLAWWFKKYAPNDDDLAKAEQQARSLKKGLWSKPNPIPPWNFRRHRVSSRHKPGQPQSTQASGPESNIIYSGNNGAMIFHQSNCRYYNYQNCTEKFNGREEAEKNGHRSYQSCNL